MTKTEEEFKNMQMTMLSLSKNVNKLKFDFKKKENLSKKKNVEGYLNQRLGIDALNPKNRKVMTNKIIDFEYNAIRQNEYLKMK
jgi:hypothetical protein